MIGKLTIVALGVYVKKSEVVKFETILKALAGCNQN